MKAVVYKNINGQKLFLLVQNPNGSWEFPTTQQQSDSNPQDILAKLLKEDLALEPQDYRVTEQLDLNDKIFIVELLYSHTSSENILKPHRPFEKEQLYPDKPYQWCSYDQVPPEIGHNKNSLEEFMKIKF